MRIFTLVFILLFCAAGWMGCNVINPKEKIPTYIHVDSFSFVPRGDTFGSSSHRITHVWMYYNNEALGAFELPATIPVKADARGRLQVAPGIDVNGLTGFRGPYPFYAFDTLTFDPQPGKVIDFKAKTYYTDATKLLFNSNFDLGNPFQKFAGDTSMVKTTNPEYVFEGGASAFIYLNGNKKISENISLDEFHPTVGQTIYLELNYKCSIPFQIGLGTFFSNGDSYKEYVAGINPKEGWNKIYINVLDFISAHQGNKYYVIVRAGTDNDEQSGWVAIDNVKVVSF